MSNMGVLITLTMVFSFGLRILLPVFNSLPLELEPEHTHFVIGAHNVHEVEQALASHTHHNHSLPGDHLSAASARAETHRGPLVVSLTNSHNGQISLFTMDTQSWFISAMASWIAPLEDIWQTVSQAFIFPSGSRILPQDPPPELFF
jgi:hypothetical protein